VAYAFERMEGVIAYVRNDHLGFTIPYLWQSQQHEYRPDYLVRLRCPGAPTGELKVILESTKICGGRALGEGGQLQG